MTYSTPLSFRVVFAVVGLVIFLSIAAVPGGPFLSRFGVVPLVLIGLCLFGALYLDRWTFDKSSNLFLQEVGILVLHASRRRPLDSLQKVVLFERGSATRGSGAGSTGAGSPGAGGPGAAGSGGLGGTDAGARPSLLGPRGKGTSLLSVVDRDGRVYRLNMARGGGARAVEVYAERLAAFCSIPLERRGGNR